MQYYKLSNDAVLECFEDGGLVLLLPACRLVELNPTAAEIVKLLDGQRTEAEVATIIAREHVLGEDISIEQVNQDVVELCLELKRDGVLELVTDL